jgi:hypothetical protein
LGVEQVFVTLHGCGFLKTLFFGRGENILEAIFISGFLKIFYV